MQVFWVVDLSQSSVTHSLYAASDLSLGRATAIGLLYISSMAYHSFSHSPPMKTAMTKQQDPQVLARLNDVMTASEHEATR